jgi:hypothetical protein
MTVRAKNLVPSAQLTGSAATYYTTPAVTRALIQKATVTNVDTVARTVTVYLVPSAGTASDTNAVIKALPVAAGTTLELFDLCGHVLEPGGFIQALASSAAVLGFRISGVEIV